MNLTFFVVLALIASVGAFSVSGGRRSFMTMVKAGEAAPDFELKTAGVRVRLSSFKNKKPVVVFITGSTGTIGSSLVEFAGSCPNSGISEVIAGYRDEKKLASLQKLLATADLFSSGCAKISPLLCDFKDAPWSGGTLEGLQCHVSNIVDRMTAAGDGFEHLVLFNNAAVCPESGELSILS